MQDHLKIKKLGNYTGVSVDQQSIKELFNTPVDMALPDDPTIIKWKTVENYVLAMMYPKCKEYGRVINATDIQGNPETHATNAINTALGNLNIEINKKDEELDQLKDDAELLLKHILKNPNLLINNLQQQLLKDQLDVNVNSQFLQEQTQFKNSIQQAEKEKIVIEHQKTTIDNKIKHLEFLELGGSDYNRGQEINNLQQQKQLKETALQDKELERKNFELRLAYLTNLSDKAKQLIDALPKLEQEKQVLVDEQLELRQVVNRRHPNQTALPPQDWASKKAGILRHALRTKIDQTPELKNEFLYNLPSDSIFDNDAIGGDPTKAILCMELLRELKQDPNFRPEDAQKKYEDFTQDRPQLLLNKNLSTVPDITKAEREQIVNKQKEQHVSTSIPLILNSQQEKLPAFVPMVWDLKDTTDYSTAAKNIGQMIRENPDRGLLLLQSVATNEDKRKGFIEELNKALADTGWKIAVDDPNESVLTLFNSKLLDIQKPKLLADSVFQANQNLKSHRVDWFSLKIPPQNPPLEPQSYCIGNMQYDDKVSATDIKADYEKFDDKYYDALNLYNNELHNFQIIFAGSLGTDLKKNTKIDNAKTFTPVDKTNLPSSVILDKKLINKTAQTANKIYQPNNIIAKPEQIYNRPDTAVYHFDKEKDKWKDTDITKVWKANGFHNMATCDKGYKFDPITLDKIKNGVNPLKIFGEAISAKALGDSDGGKKYFDNIVNNLINTFKTSFVPLVKDNLPTTINTTIPVTWEDGHVSTLGIKLDVYTQKLFEQLDDATLDTATFKDCVYVNNIEAQLIGSTIESDLTNKAQLKRDIGYHIGNAFMPGNLQPIKISIQSETHFLPCDSSVPPKVLLDDGLIATEQGLLFGENKPLLDIPERGERELSQWNNWIINQKKDYAEASERKLLELRRKFLQECEAGPKTVEKKDEAKGEDDPKKGQPTKAENRFRSELAMDFENWVNGKLVQETPVGEKREKYAAITSRNFPYYHDKNENKIYDRDPKNSSASTFGDPRLLLTITNDSVTTMDSKPDTILGMALYLRSRFNKVTLTISPRFEALYKEIFMDVGFAEENIIINFKKKQDKTPNNDPRQMMNRFG